MPLAREAVFRINILNITTLITTKATIVIIPDTAVAIAIATLITTIVATRAVNLIMPNTTKTPAIATITTT